jgi:hypothetical protein
MATIVYISISNAPLIMGRQKKNVPEALNMIPKSLACITNLFRAQTHMIEVLQEVLEHRDRSFEESRVVSTGASERLDTPKGAERERSLLATDAIVRFRDIISKDEVLSKVAR